MTTYIEYALSDGGTILVRVNESSKSIVKASSREKSLEVINATHKRFDDAFVNVKKSAIMLRQQLQELQADEVEVSFSLEVAGEAGNFAIGKVGVDASYTVTLKWSNNKKSKKTKKP